MNISKFDPMVSLMENALQTIKGELFNFANGTKKSGSVIRDALLNVAKTCKVFRKEIQEVKKSMPVRRRNITPEQKALIVAKRKATIAARQRRPTTAVAPVK